MLIDRVTIAAAVSAAIVLGLLLLSPQLFPAQDSGDDGNAAVPASPMPSPVMTVTVPAAPESSTGGPAGFGNLWAKIDPVPDVQISRPGNITIRGTTNVQPGELLRIDFIAYSMHPSPMEYHPELWFSYDVNVTSGDGGANTWSAEIRPGDFRKPDRWQILINDVPCGCSIGGGSVNVTAR